MKLFTKLACLLFPLATYPSFADSFTIETETEQKIVTLQKVYPSAKQSLQAQFFSQEKDYSKGIVPFAKSQGAVDLGMGNVPVLDQGTYGTCVTFATTAALNAALGLGDYIDQQCSLALNKALGNDYWNGAYYSSEIIDPLKQYGIVKKGGCTSQYPDSYAYVFPETYTSLKDPVVSLSAVQYKFYQAITVENVKAALNKGHRVTIGFMLTASDYDPISVQGYDIKVEGVQKRGGLWACKQSSIGNFWSFSSYCGNSQAGHEVVIVGYDDKQQLFKIRNSWNSNVGDSGEFYMTYIFFKSMVIDGTEIY